MWPELALAGLRVERDRGHTGQQGADHGHARLAADDRPHRHALRARHAGGDGGRRVAQLAVGQGAVAEAQREGGRRGRVSAGKSTAGILPRNRVSDAYAPESVARPRPRGTPARRLRPRRRAAPKPARSYTLDEAHASFRGVALGDAERGVVARFGPDQGEPNGPVGPLGQDRYDAGSPGTFASTPGRRRPDDRTKALRYHGMSFVTNERRVYVIMLLDSPRAVRLVASGSATTSTVPAGPTGPSRASTPRTRRAARPSRTASGGSIRKRYLYFGGDPIGTVAIAQVPLYGG